METTILDDLQAAKRQYAEVLIHIVRDHRAELPDCPFSEGEIRTFGQFFQVMGDGEVRLFVGINPSLDQAVVDYLESRIYPLELDERIALGRFFGTQSVWTKLGRVAGLGHREILQLDRAAMAAMEHPRQKSGRM